MKLDQADQLLIDEIAPPENRERCRRCGAVAPEALSALVGEEWHARSRVILCARCGYSTGSATIRDIITARRRSLGGLLARRRVARRPR